MARHPGSWLLALVAAVVLLAGCGGEGDPAADADGAETGAVEAVAADPAGDGEPLATVVVTMNVLADLIDVALGELVVVDSVMPRGVDPHSFELSARSVERLTEADLIVANGLNLEENVLPVVAAAAADGVPVLEIAPLVDPIAYGDVGLDGDTTQLDPHVWTDVSRMVAVPGLVVAALNEAVALAADDLAALDALVAVAEADLLALDAEVASIVAEVPVERRNLLTNHHVFGYFAERYGFAVIGAVIPGGTTLASPSAADLAELVAAIDEAGVPTLFADASSPTLLVDALATEAGIDVEVVSLWTESLSPIGEGAATYVELMRDNATRIAAGLRP